MYKGGGGGGLDLRRKRVGTKATPDSDFGTAFWLRLSPWRTLLVGNYCIITEYLLLAISISISISISTAVDHG